MSASAPCSDKTEMFFSDDHDVAQQAARICSECTTRPGCLLAALARHEPAGVWGGALFVQGLPMDVHRVGRLGQLSRSLSEAQVGCTRQLVSAGR